MRRPRETNRVVIQKMIGYCESIENIIIKFGNTFEAFNTDFTFQMACSACIIQIGELTTHLTDAFKNHHKEIAWRQIKELRNIHAHDYESVRFDVMWEILTTNIPELKKSLQKILEVM